MAKYVIAETLTCRVTFYREADGDSPEEAAAADLAADSRYIGHDVGDSLGDGDEVVVIHSAGFRPHIAHPED